MATRFRRNASINLSFKFQISGSKFYCMKKILFLFVLSLFICAASVSAQPRPMEKKPELVSTPKTPAPSTFQAKYEGGLFGFSKYEKGTLSFDDGNERLVFYGKDKKEKFSIPYKAMQVIYPQSRSVRSNTGTAVSVVPYAGVLGQFIKKKRRYMIINFDDPDIRAQGAINFKIDNQDLLDSVIYTLGEKAKLTQRGDAFYRPK